MSNQKSILIVGAGSIGERHLRCFLATGKANVSVCEPNPSLRAAMVERYAVAAAFDRYEEALDSKPAAVIICTPAHLHVSQAMQASRRGMHLLIEKPLGVALEGVDELQQEVAANSLTAAVAYVYRAHPALTAMRDYLLSGAIGAPLELVAVSGQNFPFYRPAYRDTYYKDRRTGGGAVQDALTHIINAAEWLVGPVGRLAADLDHKKIADVTVEDTAHVITRHGQVMGSFSLNQHQAPNESAITVVCERGTARFEYHQCRWRLALEPGQEWQDAPAGPLERDTLFQRQAESFMTAMAGGGPLLCTLSEAAQTLRVNLAILASAESRSWQTISN